MNFFVFWSYAMALWVNLVVPCVTNPTNWKYCFNDWDTWLYPEIRRAWDLMQGEEKPYQEEKNVLESIKNEDADE